MDIFARPEVQLGTCPEDGGHMFRLYSERVLTWQCCQCGHLSLGDPREETRMVDQAA